MKNNDGLLKILAVLTAAITVVFFTASIYKADERNFKTQIVKAGSAVETVEAEMYIIRKELTLDASAFPGIAAPLAGDAERTGKGDEIAAVFSSGKAAENYVEARALKKKLETYKRINEAPRPAGVDIGKLDSRIDASFIALTDASYYDDFSNLARDKLVFGENLSHKQIFLGERVDCSDKIEALEKEIAALDSSGAPAEIITAPAAGYYLNKTDGYENALPFDEIDSLTVEKLEKALKAEKVRPAAASIGKIIEGCGWYAAAVVDSPKMKTFSSGKRLRLILGDSEEETLTAELYSIKSVDPERALVVFKCNLMNAKLASLRKVKGKIAVGEYAGLKVNRKAVRIGENGGEGVYVRRGNILNFRSVNIIYAEDDFVIVSKPGEGDEVKSEYPSLKLYDEAIISGKELSDGMVI